MDRNGLVTVMPVRWLASLSARRAWIEIDWAKALFRYLGVALRKESVDRNVRISLKLNLPLQSLSARRAWIEIAHLPLT